MKKVVTACIAVCIFLCMIGCEEIPVWEREDEDLILSFESSSMATSDLESSVFESEPQSSEPEETHWEMTVEEPLDLVVVKEEAIEIPPRAEMNVWYEIPSIRINEHYVDSIYIKCISIEHLGDDLFSTMRQYGMEVPVWNTGEAWILKYHAYFPGTSRSEEVISRLNQFQVWASDKIGDTNIEEKKAVVLFNVENYKSKDCVEFYVCCNLPEEAEVCELMYSYGMIRTYMGVSLNN